MKKREIKEGLDNIPDGIIFAKNNGLILFANKIMYNIYSEISGKALQSAYAFWEDIKKEYNKNNEDRSNNKENPILIINEKAYEFFFETIYIKENPFLELKANDITKLYEIQKDLEKKNSDLISIQEQIILTKNSIEEISMENEKALAKMQIHDAMGNKLTKVKRNLSNEEYDTSKLMEIWGDSSNLLKKDGNTKEDNTFESLINAAKSIGVELIINGKIPEFNKISSILTDIARECLINCVTHADASEMYIDIDCDESNYLITFTNNGKSPKDKIVEGGGFEAIRRHTKEQYGSFRYSTKPNFSINITLPKLNL